MAFRLHHRLVARKTWGLVSACFLFMSSTVWAVPAPGVPGPADRQADPAELARVARRDFLKALSDARLGVPQALTLAARCPLRGCQIELLTRYADQNRATLSARDRALVTETILKLPKTPTDLTRERLEDIAEIEFWAASDTVDYVFEMVYGGLHGVPLSVAAQALPSLSGLEANLFLERYFQDNRDQITLADTTRIKKLLKSFPKGHEFHGHLNDGAQVRARIDSTR
jgi:hypothetical protein